MHGSPVIFGNPVKDPANLGRHPPQGANYGKGTEKEGAAQVCPTYYSKISKNRPPYLEKHPF